MTALLDDPTYRMPWWLSSVIIGIVENFVFSLLILYIYNNIPFTLFFVCNTKSSNKFLILYSVQCFLFNLKAFIWKSLIGNASCLVTVAYSYKTRLLASCTDIIYGAQAYSFMSNVLTRHLSLVGQRGRLTVNRCCGEYWDYFRLSPPVTTTAPSEAYHIFIINT